MDRLIGRLAGCLMLPIIIAASISNKIGMRGKTPSERHRERVEKYGEKRRGGD